MDYQINKLFKQSLIKWRQLSKTKRSIIFQSKIKTDHSKRISTFKTVKSSKLCKKYYTQYSKFLFPQYLSTCYSSIKKLFPGVKCVLNVFTFSYNNVKKVILKRHHYLTKNLTGLRNPFYNKKTAYKHILFNKRIKNDKIDDKVKRLKSSKSDSETYSKLQEINKPEIKVELDSNILYNFPSFYKLTDSCISLNHLPNEERNSLDLNDVQSFVSLPTIQLFKDNCMNNKSKVNLKSIAEFKSSTEISIRKKYNASKSFIEIKPFRLVFQEKENSSSEVINIDISTPDIKISDSQSADEKVHKAVKCINSPINQNIAKAWLKRKMSNSIIKMNPIKTSNRNCISTTIPLESKLVPNKPFNNYHPKILKLKWELTDEEMSCSNSDDEYDSSRNGKSEYDENNIEDISESEKSDEDEWFESSESFEID